MKRPRYGPGIKEGEKAYLIGEWWHIERDGVCVRMAWADLYDDEAER